MGMGLGFGHTRMPDTEEMLRHYGWIQRFFSINVRAIHIHFPLPPLPLLDSSKCARHRALARCQRTKLDRWRSIWILANRIERKQLDMWMEWMDSDDSIVRSSVGCLGGHWTHCPIKNDSMKPINIENKYRASIWTHYTPLDMNMDWTPKHNTHWRSSANEKQKKSFFFRPARPQ